MKRAPLVLIGVTLLAGCATTTIDRGLDEVRSSAQSLAGAEPRLIRTDDERRAAAAAVDTLLAKPLGADDAVRIALAHSPAAQALMHENAAAMAAAIQSGRLINPVFTFERLRRGDELEISRLLSFQLLDLLTWPLRQQMADVRFEQDKVKAIGDVVEIAADARKAWVEAIAAGQTLRYHRDVMTAAEAGAELARRMQGVGNFSKLQRAREQAFYADAAAQLARAQHAALAARERLVRLLGLDSAQARRLALPERLPDLPSSPRPEADTMKIAFEQRLDVMGAQRALEHTARLGGLTRVSSVVSRVEAGVVRNSESGLPRQRGFEVEIPLPVFDGGDALRAEMRSTYLAAVNRTRQVMLDAQSQVRETYHAYRTAYDLAHHYRDEIVPLRQAIADENLLRYNGMLIGVFELLADAREQVASVIAAIDAQREFWIADALLQNALIGRPEAAPRMFEPAPRAAAGGGGSPH
jgi:outer membrane protein TolC